MVTLISAPLNSSGENAVSAKRPCALDSASSTVEGPAKHFAVNRDQSGFAPGQHFGKAGDAHSFRSDEEKLQRAVEVIATGLAGFVAREAGVDASDLEAECG